MHGGLYYNYIKNSVQHCFFNIRIFYTSSYLPTRYWLERFFYLFACPAIVARIFGADMQDHVQLESLASCADGVRTKIETNARVRFLCNKMRDSFSLQRSVAIYRIKSLVGAWVRACKNCMCLCLAYHRANRVRDWNYIESACAWGGFWFAFSWKTWTRLFVYLSATATRRCIGILRHWWVCRFMFVLYFFWDIFGTLEIRDLITQCWDKVHRLFFFFASLVECTRFCHAFVTWYTSAATFSSLLYIASSSSLFPQS